MAHNRLFHSPNQMQSYYDVLKAPALDASDYILLTTAMVKQRHGKEKSKELAAIQQFYLFGKYDAALNQLLNLLDSIHKNDPFLLAAIKRGRQPFQDNPTQNLSRRYFETRLSEEIFHNFDKEVFHSAELLALLISDLNADFNPVVVVESAEELASVLNCIHGFGDFTASIKKHRDELKDFDDFYKSKDRGEEKIDKDHDSIFSTNPGIMKSTQPNYRTQLTNTDCNRIVDLFHMQIKTNGFSSVRAHTPFVNSASGTVFSLAAILYQFSMRHHGDPSLQTHIDNIVKSLVNLMCLNGFHSLVEILDILYLPQVQDVFTKQGLKFDIQYSQDIVASVFDQSAEYARHLCLKGVLHNELQSLAPSCALRG